MIIPLKHNTPNNLPSPNRHPKGEDLRLCSAKRNRAGAATKTRFQQAGEDTLYSELQAKSYQGMLL
tara:strand:- start:3614 stop:3811 length:198 start_codon:yes stop_codon:yes gene_type:complete